MEIKNLENFHVPEDDPISLLHLSSGIDWSPKTLCRRN